MAGWRILTRDHLFGRTTLLATLGWTLWAGLISGLPADRNATAVVLALATLHLLRLVALPWVTGPARAWLVLAVIAAATTVHGVVARTPASIVLFGAALCAISYCVGVLDTQRRHLAHQRSEQQRLSQLLDDRLAAHEISRDSLIIDLERAIDDEVARIDAPRTTSAALRRLAADVVRPVSYELIAELRRWSPPEPLRAPLHVSWARVWRGIDPVAVLMPLPLTVGLTTVALASGPLDALGTVVSVPVMTVLMAWLARRLPVTGAADSPRLAATAGVLLVTALPIAIIGRSPLVAGAAPAIGLAIALFRRAHADGISVDRALGRSLAQLEWAASRIALVEWFHRSEVSRGLHGPINLAITQTVPKLADALGRGEQTFALTGELQRRIVHGLGALVNPRAEGIDLERELTDLAATWAGMAQITFDVRPEVLPPLSADPACATAMLDTVTEASASAVRGCGASAVLVGVAPAPNAILVTVMDNGRLDGSAFEDDLVTHLLDQCAIRWYRKRISGHNALVALLPYRPDTGTTTRQLQQVAQQPR